MADKPKKPKKTPAPKAKRAVSARKQPSTKTLVSAQERYDRKFASLSTPVQYDELKSFFGWLFAPVCLLVVVVFAWQW